MTHQAKDVFISWTGADRDVKNALAERLQQEGISCWDSDEHCTSDFSEECIQAIRRSKVFIVLVSDAAMRKGYVINEVITARDQENQGLLNILVYKLTDAPYASNFEFQLNHISFVTGNLVQRRRTLSDDAIGTLVKRTRRLLQLRAKGTPELPYAVEQPQVSGQEMAGTGYYVPDSRAESLQELENALEKSNLVILQSMFGYGKRTLARLYAHTHRKDILHPVMVSQSGASLRDFFLTELRFSNINPGAFEELPPDRLLEKKLAFLGKLPPEALLVISNVRLDSGTDIALCQQLCALPCRILLLTQNAPAGFGDWCPVLRLGRLSQAQLCQLFFHHYEFASPEEQTALQPVLSRFFDSIGGHTLTVALTATILSREMGVPPEELEQYLCPDSREDEGLQERILGQLSQVLAPERFSEQERHVLLVCALMASPVISQANLLTLLRSCGSADWKTVMALHSRCWLEADLRSRSVFMEPMLARIMLERFPPDYGICAECLRFIMEQISSLRSTSESFRLAEGFFRRVRMPEVGEIFALNLEYMQDSRSFPREKLSHALEHYQNSHASLIAEAEARDEDVSEPAGGWDRDSFLVLAVRLLQETVIPASKAIACDTSGLLLDLSAAGDPRKLQQLKQLKLFNTSPMDLFGISDSELTGLLQQMRQAARKEELDDDDVETALFLETINALEAYQNRDFASLMVGLNSVLEYLISYPEVAAGMDSQCLYTPFLVLMQSYALQQNDYQAISLGNRLLSHMPPGPMRSQILSIYIRSMRSAGLYEQALFDAYRSYLKDFDTVHAQTYPSRDALNRDKKNAALMYAADLAAGFRPEEARKQFAQAQLLGKQLLPENTLLAAAKIIDALSATGCFDEAMDFLEAHYTPQALQPLTASDDPDVSKAAWELLCFLQAELYEAAPFDREQDPTQHLNYYQKYSRENNVRHERKYTAVADKALSFDYSGLSDSQLADTARQLRSRAKREGMLSLAPEAFALASEAGLRVLGYRHHYVQYTGAAAMADGKIAEILNGEGKTYTIVLTAFLNALYGRNTFVVDASEYLTRRNYDWKHGVYALLGISCAHVHGSESLFMLGSVQAEVIYIDLKSLVFSYLRTCIQPDCCSPDLSGSCILLDEADQILVDKANTPYLYNKAGYDSENIRIHRKVYPLATQFHGKDEYYYTQGTRIILTPKALPHIEQRFHLSYDYAAHIASLQRIEQALRTALMCLHMEQDRDYHLIRNVPMQENRSTGVFEPMTSSCTYFLQRRHGLNTTATEKELGQKHDTLNQICLKDFFLLFGTLCGTTATAAGFRKEFREIYGLDFYAVPPCRPCIRLNQDSPFYFSTQAKDRAILALVRERHAIGQPILIVTQSIPESEKYAAMLRRGGIPHKLLNARNSDDSQDLLAMAGVCGSVLVATALANRGVDIRLGGSPELMARRELVQLGVNISELDALIYARPSREQRESELFRTYSSTLEKNRRLAASQRSAAVEAGGLLVIGTSFFPELRTQQQTQGRSGRQGDVGESQIFRSIDDESIRELFSPAYREWLISSGVEGECITSRMVIKSLQQWQQKLHDQAFKAIRSCNHSCSPIESARSRFFRLKDSLCRGELTPQELLAQWCSDKQTLQQLALLQKGEEVPSALLTQLFRNYPEQLSGVRSVRAGQLLNTLSLELLRQKFGDKWTNATDVMCLMLISGILIGWQSYLKAVHALSSTTPDKEQARQLAREADQLLRGCTEECFLRFIRKA